MKQKQTRNISLGNQNVITQNLGYNYSMLMFYCILELREKQAVRKSKFIMLSKTYGGYNTHNC